MLPFLTLATELDPNVLPGVSALCSFGFTGWFAYYVVTNAMPKVMDDHRSEREKDQEANRKERAEMQERHDAQVHALLAELKESRMQFTAWMTTRGSASTANPGSQM